MTKRNPALLLLLIVSHTLQAQIKTGDQAPDLRITNWIQNVPQQKTLTGKLLVVDFWATWCGPCLGSVPHLNELAEQHKNNKNLQFVSISDEKESKIRKLLPKVHFASLVVADSTGQTFKDYGIQSIPYCVLIDDHRQVQWAGTASELTAEMVSQFVQKKPVVAPPAKSRLSEATRQLYDSLRREYNHVYSDKAIKEFFALGPLTNQPYGSHLNQKGSTMYNEVTIGKGLHATLANLLEVSETQVVLQPAMSKAFISYCYKSVAQHTNAGLLGHITRQLDIEATTYDSLQQVMTLEVTDTSLLYADLPEPTQRTSRISSSDGDKIISVSNHQLINIKNSLQDRFSCIVVIKDGERYNRRINMTIMAEDFSKFITSMAGYGIKVTKQQQQVRIYTYH